MTEDKFLEKLKSFTKSKYKNLSEAGDAWGCSSVMAHHMINGNRKPSDAVLNDIGFERVVNTKVVYRKLNAE